VNALDPRGRGIIDYVALVIRSEIGTITIAVGCGFAIKSALDLLKMDAPSPLDYDGVEAALAACALASVAALVL
jgi:hypothetical protein